MKKVVLFSVLSFLITKTVLCQNNTNRFALVDSTILFGKVDSLKQNEHTEFALSTFTVSHNSEDELNLIVNTLGNNVFPEGYVMFYGNKTYYPKTEYINEGTDKKFNDTFIYVDNSGFETTIYMLRSSNGLKR